MFTIQKTKYRHLLLLGLVLTFTIIGDANASCGSAFCSINTQWDVQGVSANAGTRIGLRYEAIPQDQLREGRDRISVNDLSGVEHAEIKTKNRNWILSIDHAVNQDWGISVAIPYVDRFHEHIHDPEGAAEDEIWDFTNLGDIRITGKYKPTTNKIGLRFGLKLPTGNYDVTNNDGEEAERSLQPGSGTTDAIFGVYHNNHSLSSPSSWFTTAQIQQSINSRADFRPGYHLTLDGGYHYAVNQKVGLMVQLNTLIKGKDKGNNAEPEDSGGEFIFLSPGLNVVITRAVQVFAYFQQPIYQRVNGVQLTTDKSYIIGVNGRF
ncbi:MAG: transporter [Gammaproteobacteria bacterium]